VKTDQRTPLSRDALTDRVYAVLRGKIIDLDLEPGSRLNIDQLARDLAVSPTPIREALNRLTSERLVLLEPYRGFRVARLLNRDELRDLFEARVVIEAGAIATSVDRLRAEDHDRLSALVQELDVLAGAPVFDVDAFNAADASLHRITVAGSGNSFLADTWDDLKVHAQIARHFKGRSAEEAAAANAEHREILAAIVARDAEAARMHVTRHVHAVYSRLDEPGVCA
jgi:DNA-binding GntR family transcriptional regulator